MFLIRIYIFLNVYRNGINQEVIRDILTRVNQNDQRIRQLVTNQARTNNLPNLVNQLEEVINLRLNNVDQYCDILQERCNALERETTIQRERYNHIAFLLSLSEDVQRASQELYQRLNNNRNEEE